MTITTPNGAKVRSTSNRRFFVVAEFEHTESDRPMEARVDLRTDNVATARRMVERKGAVDRQFGGLVRRMFIFDSMTMGFVR